MGGLCTGRGRCLSGVMCGTTTMDRFPSIISTVMHNAGMFTHGTHGELQQCTCPFKAALHPDLARNLLRMNVRVHLDRRLRYERLQFQKWQ